MGQKPRSQLPQYCDGARLNLQETSYLVQVPDERAHPTESRSYCPMRQHETNDGDRTDRVVSLCSMTDFQWDEPVRLELAPVMTSQLTFCGHNHIHHFFCDIKPLLNLACSSTSLNMTLLNVITTSVALGSFALIVLSYLYLIFFTFHKVRSQEGRWKPFTTCASHLTVVALLYIPVLFNYTPPSSGSSLKRDVQVSLLYSAVTPALNPLIYTLRNPEKRSALKKMLCFEWT
ncbi:olfactory receptor 12D3-like protein [Columba livia]|nr:olfactory receptor 12D3-like protein [Columba livia]